MTLCNTVAMRPMTLKLSSMILLAALGASAASLRSECATGRACYIDGEFKRAVTHFQLALKANPADADSYYWIGMSYQAQADIAFPFGGKYASKARLNLTRATELAPGRLDYRRELFECLLNSAGSSRSALRQAAGILRAVAPNDPDYERMRQQFDEASKAYASADARLGRLFLAVPQAAYRIADVAASGASTRITPLSGASSASAFHIPARNTGSISAEKPVTP
jgi:tetratricopeptide (TPR) repeat protein